MIISFFFMIFGWKYMDIIYYIIFFVLFFLF